MPQFFIKSENIADDNIILDNKSDIKHIIDVLRRKIGDEVFFIDDNEIFYVSQILNFSKNQLVARVLRKEKSIRSLSTEIVLVQSILKSSAQDYVIQKATELGVKKIVPMKTKYSVVKIDGDKDSAKKVEKWQKNAFESCKQCERSKMPEIASIVTFEDVVKLDFDIKIACVERSFELSLKEFLRQTPYIAGKKVGIFIGPEGGWSDAELDAFSSNGFAKVSLGNMILRAETAVVAALAGVIYEYEN